MTTNGQVDLLVEALETAEVQERRRILVELRGVLPMSERVLEALSRATRDPDDSVRLVAVESLGLLGPAAVSAVRPLIGLMRHSSRLRCSVRDALGAIGAGAVPSLSVVLVDADSDVRRTVAESLGLIGSGATAAVPELQHRLNDPDDLVRSSARQALGRIRETVTVG